MAIEQLSFLRQKFSQNQRVWCIMLTTINKQFKKIKSSSQAEFHRKNLTEPCEVLASYGSSYYRYTTEFGQYQTLFCLESSSALHMPYMRFLFAGARVLLWLALDSPHDGHTCPRLTTSYCQACSVLSPPSYFPFRANNKKQSLLFKNEGL